MKQKFKPKIKEIYIEVSKVNKKGEPEVYYMNTTNCEDWKKITKKEMEEILDGK